MTKVRQRIQRSPEAEPVAGVEVRVVRDADDATLGTLASDADGYVTYQADGHPGPFTFRLDNQPGGTKFWSSYDAMAVGPLSLVELPAALSALGDGVVRGHGGELAVSFLGTTQRTDGTVLHNFAVAPGAALVAGHPFVVYAPYAFSVTRPAVPLARIDRAVIRLNRETGEAAVVGIAGTVDAPNFAEPPALTQTATQYEVSLAQITVPAVAAPTITDEREYAGDRLGDSGIARAARVSTTSAGGEALSGLSVTLDLPRDATYDVEADFTARQVDTAATTNWVLQGTFGSLGSGTSPNFNNPQQVAVDSSGNVYVADRNNNRVVKLNSSGVYQSHIGGAFGVHGVAVDGSGNVYVADATDRVIAKFNSAGVLQASFSVAPNPPGHIATDGTFVYFTMPGLNIWCRLSVALTGFAAFPASGPAGIATDGTHVYVAENGVSRIRKCTTAGVFVAQWGQPGTGSGDLSSPQGVALDASGNVWVADLALDRLQRFGSTGTWQVTIPQDNPVGVAVAAGDVVWASNRTGHNVAKWDEVAGGGGYGLVSLEIDGDVSANYIGIGERDGAVAKTRVTSAAGPDTLLVRAFGKATEGTMTLAGCVLSARATPRG